MSFPIAAPLAVISPHLDDAALGCGDLLAGHPGALVVTVFAGSPSSYDRLTEWDALAGFAPGDDVMAVRRDEDRAALGVLGARPVWLPFLDAQYGAPPRIEELARELEAAVRRAAPRTVLMPLGLFHSDHRLAHDAALEVARRHPGVAWLAYEEPNYRLVPDAVRDRLAALEAGGVTAALHSAAGPAGDAKRRAIRCYRSQMRALRRCAPAGFEDSFAPERYWELRLPGSWSSAAARHTLTAGRVQR